MLAVRELDHFYGESRTLWGMSLEVEKGTVTCLMGRNGVGKTTLLKCVMGLAPLAGGDIVFGDESLSRSPPEARAPAGIGYVPQGRGIFSRLTVAENLAVGLAAHPGRREIPERIYELFPVLWDMRRRRGGDLSGGQQQQLAIGRALTLEPRLLILDEPTEGIQPNIVHEIGDLIGKLKEELGMTVLVVEQKLPFVRRVADRFVIMDKGRQVATGSLADLSEQLVKQYLTV